MNSQNIYDHEILRRITKISLIILSIGLLLLFVSLFFSSSFVEKHLSADNNLTTNAITMIKQLRLLSFAFGLILIFISQYIKKSNFYKNSIINYKCGNIVYDKKIYITASISLFILFVINTIIGLTGDVTDSFAAAFQADYLGEFPVNVYQSFNLRGLGYKYLMYILYKITNIFVKLDNFVSFQILTKFIYYFFFFGISYVFLQIMNKTLKKMNIYWANIYILFIYAILLTSRLIHLQAEEASIFFTLGLFSFAMSEKKYLNYLSGIFISILFLMKGSTIIYIGYPFLFILYLTLKYRFLKKNLIRLIISDIIFIFLTVLLLIFIIPQEIIDLKNATMIQSSAQFHIGAIPLFVFGTFRAIAHIPIILIGIISFIYISFKKLIEKRIYSFIILFLLFILPVLGVLLQHKFFPYHYSFFIPFSIFTFFIFICHHSLKSNKPMYLLTISLLIYGLAVLSPIHIKWMPKNSNAFLKTHTYSQADKDSYLIMREKFDLENQKEILFLSRGEVNYFIRTKSYLRRFFPVFLHRSQINPKLKEHLEYQKSISKVLEYKGKYIFHLPNYIKLENFPQINIKITDEYRIRYVCENGSILYERVVD